MDTPDHQDNKSARDAWEWIFQSDGFFRDYDKAKEEKEKAARLKAVAATVANGTAKTSSIVGIGAVGVPNLPHRFYGDSV